MNKEEILNTFLLANIPEIITQEEFNDVKRAIKQLLQENQELKSQLAGTTHCFDEEEHRKLKDEIKKLERIIELCHLDAKETLATINYEQELQQKEFIKYLEDEWAKHEYISSHEIDDNIRHTEEKIRSNIFEILQKYKETIQTKIDKSV